MNTTLSVSEDLNRESGYTVFTVSGVEGNIERLSYSVVRHGYDYNYIGESGWQAAFAWLEPEDAWYESGQLKFVVPPDVTWQMDPQGYMLKLDLYPSVEELSINFFWPDVLPAEAATIPDVEHQLSGTRVKPATEAPAIEPQLAVTPEPEPTSPQPEPEAVVVPAPVIPTSAKKGLGMGTVVAIVSILLVALAAFYWFMPRTGDKTTPEQTAQPSVPASNEAADLPKPEPVPIPQPLSESIPEPVVEPEPIVEPPVPVVTEAQEIQEKRGNDTQIKEQAVVVEEDTAAQDSAPGTPRTSDIGTLDTLTGIMGTGASKQPSRTEDDIFNSIEPALREQVGE